jgi:hypothetical protein
MRNAFMSGVITDGKQEANSLRTFRLGHSEVDDIDGEAGGTLSMVSDNIARYLEIEWNWHIRVILEINGSARMIGFGLFNLV